MGTLLGSRQKLITVSLVVLLIFYDETESATLKDVFTLSTQPISRIPRDNKYSANRYATNRDDTIKPEESPEARDDQDTRTNVEKRCSRCDSQYSDYNRYPSSYDTRTRYDGNRYDNNRYDDRYYESKRNRDRYDYDDRDRYYDRYDRDRGYDRRVDYDRYDRGYDRGSYDRGGYDRGGYDKGGYDKGGYDRVGYDRGYDRGYDKHDNRDRYYDRGSGYDNRGYDYRGGYRPWDETYRGTSGWDSSGRGFYFATGRPESSSSYGSGYASSWNYGGGRDNYNRDRGGYGSGTSYRPRDPYEVGYRGTSYLYGRPSSSTTTGRPTSVSDSDNSVTDSPQTTNSS